MKDRSYQDWIFEQTEPTRRDLDGNDVDVMFFEQFSRSMHEIDRYYLPIFWGRWNRDKEADRDRSGRIDRFLRDLDPGKRYFTVAESGHDGYIPPRTRVYTGGGWGTNESSIGYYRLKSPPRWPEFVDEVRYVPLVKSNGVTDAGWIKPKANRKFFAAFHGTFATHECREWLRDILKNERDFLYSDDRLASADYIAMLCDTVFALAPRGDCPYSYRMFEAMRCGAIPVYISDEFYLPYEDRVDWSELCVTIHFSRITGTAALLRNFAKDAARLKHMQKKIREFSRGCLSRRFAVSYVIAHLKEETRKWRAERTVA